LTLILKDFGLVSDDQKLWYVLCEVSWEKFGRSTYWFI